MGQFKKYCKNPDCGKEFIGTKTQQYCCPACRVPTYIPKKPRVVKPKKPCSIDEIAVKARQAGMTYGKYVEKQTIEMLRQERMNKKYESSSNDR